MEMNINEIGQTSIFESSELEHIVSILTAGPFDIEYIILFGKLVGGTPLSNVAAYDMLIVTDRVAAYGWREIKRYLRYHLPIRHRNVAYHNICVMSRKQTTTNKSPLSFFAHTQGKVVYSRVEDPLLPTRGCDFMNLYCNAKTYAKTILSVANEYMDLARLSYPQRGNHRAAAILTAQAAAFFYRTLHYVYYGGEIDTDDIIVMHDKLRCLDGEMMLLFDCTHIGSSVLLPTLQGLKKRFPFDPTVNILPPVLETIMTAVQRLGEIVGKLSDLRIKLYKSYL